MKEPVLLAWPIAGRFGGTETMIARLARGFRDAGHPVWVLCRDTPMVPRYREAGATVMTLDALEWEPSLQRSEEFLQTTARIIAALPSGCRPRIITFDAKGLMIGGMVAMATQGRLFAYVVHPLILASVRAEVLQKLVSLGRLFSINEGCLDPMMPALGELRAAVPLLPVAIPESEPLQAQPREQGQLRILSVARLEPDKRYLFGLVRAMAAIRSHFPRATLTIVGDGSLRKALQEEVQRVSSSTVSRMVGAVPPEQLADFYRDCDVYVGMGTTALLAAMYGRPTLVVRIDDEEQHCLGLLQHQRGFNFGESDPATNVVPLVDAVVETCAREERRQELAREAHAYVMAHHTERGVMPRVLSHVEQAKDGPVLVTHDDSISPAGETRWLARRTKQREPRVERWIAAARRAADVLRAR
ncbi:MAG: glycosyltransferase family 4 protein [Myxococcota bacterium]